MSHAQASSPGRTIELAKMILAVCIVSGAYALVLQQRLQEIPNALIGFGFHPEALTQAPVSKQLHLVAGVLAMALGVFQLVAAKGTARHRATGYAWVAVMMMLSLSALFIENRIGILQLLAVIVLGLLARAVWLARRCDVARHAHLMRVLVL